MRAILSTALLLAVLLSGASAQPQDTFLAYSFTSYTTPVVLYEVSPTGSVLKTVASLPAGILPQGVVMAEDNRSYRVTGLFYTPPTYVGAVLDVSSGGTVTTLVNSAPLYYPSSMLLDSDGDWLILNRPRTSTNLEILRLRGKTLTRLSSTGTIYMYTPGAAFDEDSGQIVVRAQTRVSPISYGYFRVDPATGTVTNFALHKQATSVAYGAKELVYEGPTSAVVDLSYEATSRGMKVVRVHPEIGIFPISTTPIPGLGADMTAAGQRTAGTAYYTLIRNLTAPIGYSIVRLKSDGSVLGSSLIQGFTPYLRSCLLRIGNRHLHWSLDTPPNGRTLHLDFPGEAGYGYFVGLSLAGVRPGPLLGDGREIPLVPDALTLLCVQGGVAGVVEKTLGFLDIQGRAQVKVDTNAFGAGLKGLKIWAAALVLDPKAASGVAYVVGPTLLAIKQ